jgi:hypothetical protein
VENAKADEKMWNLLRESEAEQIERHEEPPDTA